MAETEVDTVRVDDARRGPVWLNNEGSRSEDEELPPDVVGREADVSESERAMAVLCET